MKVVISDAVNEEQCCCRCKHNIRKKHPIYRVICECEIDGHYIGYVANFECVCKMWEEAEDGVSN